MRYSGRSFHETGSHSQKTGETDISVNLSIDGSGRFEGTTGIGFFDHMMNLLACHSGMDISISCQGDLEVDNHHTIEDLGITLGDALLKALGDKKGIRRYGAFFCPMDEVLSRIVLDLSGRPYFVYDVKIPVERIGTFETEMTREFFLAFAMHGMMNLHMACLYGETATIWWNPFQRTGTRTEGSGYRGKRRSVIDQRGALMKTAVIDYDAGNLANVVRAAARAGLDVVVTRNPEEIKNASALILPGVGAMKDAMEHLDGYGLSDLIREEVKKARNWQAYALACRPFMKYLRKTATSLPWAFSPAASSVSLKGNSKCPTWGGMSWSSTGPTKYWKAFPLIPTFISSIPTTKPLEIRKTSSPRRTTASPCRRWWGRTMYWASSSIPKNQDK